MSYISTIHTKTNFEPRIQYLIETPRFFYEGLHRMYLFVALEVPKVSDLLLDSPAPADCDNWARYKLNNYVNNNTCSHPLHELVHSEVCHSFRMTYTELFHHINMRKQNITLKRRNHLPAILPNQIFYTNKDKASKISIRRILKQKNPA